jgi:dihydrodipicolinate synthase/N-acetylneuraminate lyase
MPKPLFRGVCASSITPFHPDGRLWLERLKPHIDWLIQERVDAISPLGSSGEFPAMECAIESDLPRARELWNKLAPLMRLQFQAYHSKGEGAHWFSTMKAALNMIGPAVGDPQPPVLPLPASHRKTLVELLKNLGYQVNDQG